MEYKVTIKQDEWNKRYDSFAIIVDEKLISMKFNQENAFEWFRLHVSNAYSLEKIDNKYAFLDICEEMILNCEILHRYFMNMNSDLDFVNLSSITDSKYAQKRFSANITIFEIRILENKDGTFSCASGSIFDERYAIAPIKYATIDIALEIAKIKIVDQSSIMDGIPDFDQQSEKSLLYVINHDKIN